MCSVDLVSGLRVSADGQPPQERNLAICGPEIATGDDGRLVLKNDKEMHREPRVVFDRLAAFLRRAPKTGKMDPRGAEHALTHMRAIVDRGGMSSTKLTPEQKSLIQSGHARRRLLSRHLRLPQLHFRFDSVDHPWLYEFAHLAVVSV
uniref:Uncharacterized protein n=1 Tax=Hyaloperonospora arabidopsidis (strain Emoy2) TaxID=559515 RepID=M4BPG6_HYAAE